MKAIVTERISLLGAWCLLTLASLLSGFAGVFAAYAFDASHSLRAALGFAWPMAMISGAIGAFVVVGPVLTAWSAWEIFVLDAPNDVNGLAFIVSLPPTLTLAILAAAAWFGRSARRALPLWPITLSLAPLTSAAIFRAGTWMAVP